MKTNTVGSFSDADELLLEYAGNEATRAKEEAKMNERIQSIRDDFNARTRDMLQRNAEIEKAIEAFCIQHKDEFEKTKSRELLHGQIGFRTNPPKVSLLNRKYNLKTVLELTRRIFKGGYLRKTEEIDKEKILADYSAKSLTDAELAAVGLRVDQQEQAGILSIKWESIEQSAA